MNEQLILWGAGTTGRVIVRDMREKGLPSPILVDSNNAKWGTVMEGVDVMSPGAARAKYPDGVWIASSIIPELWN